MDFKIADRCRYIKYAQGKLLKKGKMLIILNEFHKLCEKYSTMAINSAEFTSVPMFIINAARSERSKAGILPSLKNKKNARNLYQN